MNLKLFQSYTADVLRCWGLVAPSDSEAWFHTLSDGTAHALFFTPDEARCWCFPPVSDRKLNFFFSPSRLRFGIDRCANKDELLNFHATRFQLPNEHTRVHLFALLSIGQWCYLGKPVLGSGYGSGKSLNQLSPNQLEISLDEKLPEWLWHHFGGYRGWLVCMYPHQFVIQGACEAEALLTTYWGEASPSLEITRYEEDCLAAVTDTTGACVLTYRTGITMLHSGSASSESNDGFRVFGDFEFPQCWAISRQEAIRLIRCYLDTGSPTGLVEG